MAVMKCSGRPVQCDSAAGKPHAAHSMTEIPRPLFSGRQHVDIKDVLIRRVLHRSTKPVNVTYRADSELVDESTQVCLHRTGSHNAHVQGPRRRLGSAYSQSLLVAVSGVPKHVAGRQMEEGAIDTWKRLLAQVRSGWRRVLESTDALHFRGPRYRPAEIGLESSDLGGIVEVFVPNQ